MSEAVISDDMVLKNEPGWFGVFTRYQHPEAKYKNGDTVEKVWEEPGDGTPLGTKGAVLGSIGFPDIGYLYFVEWGNRPKYAVAVVEKKLGRVEC